MACVPAACGDAAADRQPVATIGGVGQLPDLTPIPSNRDDQRSADANGSTSSTLPPPPTTAVSVENTVGAKAAGNRI
ncbi:MAG TPA: hypothetical protein PKV27_08050, partial [Ilumatobacteraceae bacterium]|nr:hypothetical protein [Ilumatobacteraceae bacterium]